LRRLLVVAAIAISILIGGGILLWQIIFRM
jgi:hypothetical protein